MYFDEFKECNNSGNSPLKFKSLFTVNRAIEKKLLICLNYKMTICQNAKVVKRTKVLRFNEN